MIITKLVVAYKILCTSWDQLWKLMLYLLFEINKIKYLS